MTGHAPHWMLVGRALRGRLCFALAPQTQRLPNLRTHRYAAAALPSRGPSSRPAVTVFPARSFGSAPAPTHLPL